jgi:Domain of unknown function (DUF4136)
VEGTEQRVARLRNNFFILVLAVGVCLAILPGDAAVKVRVDFDKAFDFAKIRTWAWNPSGAGRVFLARTPDDDPDLVKQRAEPVILEAVNTEMPRRGLKPAAGSPDVTITYYLLMTIGSSTQTMGQFLPSTTQWGLPPFAPSTTAITVAEQGSLVFDLSANGEVVWRGIGEAKIKMELDQQKRTTLLREAVGEILKRFPPKK